MDAFTIFTLVLAAAATVLAAAVYGILPERIDVTFVFAAYAAGTVVGALVTRWRGGERTPYPHRWGLAFMGGAAIWLALGLSGALS